MPDAIILEGPKAGGHIGFSYKTIKKSGENFLKDYDLLDVLLPEVMKFLQKYGYNIPVFVAGGIRTKEHIAKARSIGATGVQIASQLIVVHESGASEEFKDVVIESSDEDVVLGTEEWGSPAQYSFRYSKKSPLVKEMSQSNFFCICRSLICATPYEYLTNDKAIGCPEGYVKPLHSACPAAGNIIDKALYTMGSEVNSITKRRYAAEIIRDLTE